MNEVVYLKLQDDIILYEDPGITTKKYFLLSENRSVNIKLDKKKFDYLNLVIPYLDKNYTKRLIEEELYRITGESVDITQAIDYLNKTGLTIDSEKKVLDKLEFVYSAKQILMLPLDKVQDRYKTVMKWFFIIVMVISVAIIVYGSILVIGNWKIIGEIFLESKDFTWSLLTIKEMLIIYILGFLSVAIHELGHLLTANYFGIKLRSFNISLIMGISPIAYVRYKNYYANPSRNKVITLLAGAFFNLVLGCLFWILANKYEELKYIVLMFINFGMAFSTLSVLGVTDGYYIITILLNIEGMRWNMLKTVGDFLNGKKTLKSLFSNKKIIVLSSYFLISYVTTFIGVFYIINKIIDYVDVNTGASRGIVIVLSLIFISIVLLMLKRFIASLKEISDTSV